MTINASQLACCIRDMTQSLAQDAHDAGLATLAYLLEMTAMEAAEASAQPKRRAAAARVH